MSPAAAPGNDENLSFALRTFFFIGEDDAGRGRGDWYGVAAGTDY